MPNLSLTEIGSGFVLSGTDDNGRPASLTLNEDDVIKLAQSLTGLRDRVLARRSRTGAEVVVPMPVERISLTVDAHIAEIHLAITSPRGERVRLALPYEVARMLADRLPVRVADIEAAAGTRR